MKFSECGCGRWSTTSLVIASISQTNVPDVWLLLNDAAGGFCAPRQEFSCYFAARQRHNYLCI